MILYLDQGILINLSRDGNLLKRLKEILKQKNAKIALSFAHVQETAKWKNNIKLIETIEDLPCIKLTELKRIFECELDNEFYRFLNFDKRRSMDIIDDDSGDHSFRDFVNQARRNTNNATTIKSVNYTYEDNIKRDLAIRPDGTRFEEDLLRERENLLNGRVNEYFTPKKIYQLIGMHLPSKCLDAQEFVKKFDFTRCPYLSTYNEFQTRRYRDKKRNPQNDLADIEHAVHGALSCDVLVIEGNAANVIRQMDKTGSIKAKFFTDLNTAMDYLENASG